MGSWGTVNMCYVDFHDQMPLEGELYQTGNTETLTVNAFITVVCWYPVSACIQIGSLK